MSTFQYKGACECKESSISVRVACSEACEMNVILIPFFLAANVAVNDTSEWTFGPEYTYNLNINYMMKTDPHEPVETMQLISTIKCRPKVPDSLFCHLQNSTALAFIKARNMSREVKTEEMFEIKFNEHGVVGLVIEPPNRMEVVNVLRKIANQFSVDLDRRRIDMSQFMARENSSMGNCATVYKITREEPVTEVEDRSVETVEAEDTDFRLMVLPMVDMKPGTTLSIEKSRMGCINPPRYVEFLTGILKMGRFVSKIRVNNRNRFETLTEFDGKVRLPSENTNRVLSFKEIMQLNLDSIEPAQNELPTISYGELIDLNTNNDIPSNYIN